MSRSLWTGALIVLAALALHLSAHVSLRAPHTREALPEDTPAIAANTALAARPGESWTAPVERALAEPDASWSPAGARAGAMRWRPVSTAALALQRTVAGDGVLVLAGLVSLLLHVAVALQSAALVRDLRGPPAAAALAGLLVAACPAALPAAAWPAHQGVVLAGALGLAGLRVALRRSHGTTGALLGGVLLALAGLSHELAFGLLPAALTLRACDRRRAAARPARVRDAALVLPPVLALGARLAVAPPSVAAALAGASDGVAGALAVLAGLLVPGRLRLAASAAPAGTGGVGLIGVVSLVVAAVLGAGAVWLLWRHRDRGWTAAALALLASLSPLLLVGGYGGAAHQDAYAYAVLPLFAGAVALLLAASVRRAPMLRVGAAAAGALLLGAYVAGTLARAPAFRSRGAFIALAAHEMPSSPVVRAWQLGARIVSAEALSSGRDEGLVALQPDVREVLASFGFDADGDADGDGEPPLRRDAVAAATGGAVLGHYADTLTVSRLDPDHEAWWAAESAAEAATVLLPDWAGSWTVLASVRQRSGALAGAYDAAARADDVEGGRRDLALRAASLALELGDARGALRHLDRLDAGAAGPVPGARLLRARAVALDATAQQLSYEFEEAARLLQELIDGGDRSAAVLAAAYDTYLLWADHLVALDKTGMALIAYRKAASLRGPESSAAEHLGWLRKRVDAELAAAQAEVERARTEDPEALADALLQLGIAHSRRGEWEIATEIFRKLETHQGGLNAPLRFAVARHLYSSRIPDGLESAEREFRLVLEEEPRFVEARYRLAQVLLQRGRLREALEQFEIASEEGVAYDWSIDALLLARRIEEVLRSESPPR